MCSAGSARPDQAGFFLPKEQRMRTKQTCAHVCTTDAELWTQISARTFRIRACGRSYNGQYLSSSLAVMLTQCFHRVHNVSAVRVSV